MSLDERTATRDLAGTPGGATGNLTIGQIAVGTISGAGGPLGDRDLYVFRTQPGLVYRIDTAPATWPSLTSTPNPLPYFVLRDTAGTVLDQAVLVDGRYQAADRLGHDLRGSANQALHLLTARHSRAEVEATPEAEIRIARDGTLEITGVAPLTVRSLR